MKLITQMKQHLREDGGIEALTRDLLDVSADVEDDMMGPGEDEPTINVRLRYWSGSWQLLTGDAQYDQDHRGFWGSSSVWQGMTEGQAGDIAHDLVEQVFEAAAFDGEE